MKPFIYHPPCALANTFMAKLKKQREFYGINPLVFTTNKDLQPLPSTFVLEPKIRHQYYTPTSYTLAPSLVCYDHGSRKLASIGGQR
jgi:hypothetical protein